jgi:Ni/Co efflux regulator RcnB
MRATVIASAAFAAALGFSAAAFAQDQHGHGGGHGNWNRQGAAPQAQRAPQQHLQRQWQGTPHANYQAAPQRNFERNYAWQQPQRQYAPAYSQRIAPAYSSGYAPRNYAYASPRWHRGDVLPWQYRQRYGYVDWRAHSLYAPPYGYQWVEDDSGDFLLVALATGLIANLLVN